MIPSVDNYGIKKSMIKKGSYYKIKKSGKQAITIIRVNETVIDDSVKVEQARQRLKYLSLINKNKFKG